MAKQIYIDENGNPIEVSGTINNASMLPISANDSTDTKSYIDTGLSGKADTSDLSTVATSGIYNDLLNKPTKEFKTGSVYDALQITFPDDGEKKFLIFGSTVNDKTLFGVFYARGSNNRCYGTSLGAYSMAIKAHSSLANTFLINIGTYGGGAIVLSIPQEVSITYASYS